MAVTTPSAIEPEVELAIDTLRAYLDRVGFREIYKFVVGVNRYGVVPSIVNRTTAAAVRRFFDTVLSRRSDLLVVQSLLVGRRFERRAVGGDDREIADTLAAGGLLERDGWSFGPGPWQLISAFDLELLVDRRIHFGGGVHDVYIGVDSHLMLYYVDAAGIDRRHRALDLCTGTGICALYLSRFSDRVVATDIGRVPLALARLNRRLNRREGTVEIRDQDLRETLDGGERFDVLTCNPPFVAYPPGIRGTLYSQGTGADGLGYMRLIIERLTDVLTPGGSAYLVADLVGDLRRPHFISELEDYADRDALAIDVYIDNVLPASVQVAPLVEHMEQLDRAASRPSLTAELVGFQRDTLRAERYYLSTVKLRTAAPAPGVRVLRRYPLPEDTAGAWPEILTTT